jgi:hypothetical protein
MPSEPQRFYRWVDASGTLHVVSSLDAVPPAERARAERTAFVGHEEPSPRPAMFRLDWSSVALGFGAGLLVALVLPRGWKAVTRVGVVVAIAALLGGAYLATLRNATDTGDGALIASPAAIIEDAKAAVAKANEAQRRRERELEQIREQGR